MNLIFSIASRYLFGKKTTNAINIITWISVTGIAIGTAALILILSVFNGFEGLLSGLFNAYSPDLKVKPKEGVFLTLDDTTLAQIRKIKGVKHVAKVLEEVALFEYDGAQEAGYLKGVDTSYTNVTTIDSTIVSGAFVLQKGSYNYCVLGSGMYNKLRINPGDGLTTISVYLSAKDKNGPLEQQYSVREIYPAGVFTAGNEDDAQYILASYDFVNELMNNEDNVSSLELKIDLEQETSVKSQLQQLMGNNVSISNRMEQDATFLRIMNIEKWISYLIASLTMILISFNLVGCLWMIVLDKRKDIAILRSMGLNPTDIRKIFVSVGLLIGVLGLIIGFGIALILYFLQKQYDLISVPAGFLIEGYPIELRALDFGLVILTVLLISFLASLLPAHRSGKISAFVRHE